MRDSIIRWLSVAAWMTLIFIGSSMPADSLPQGPRFLPIAAHLIEFFVLTVLLVWGLNGGFGQPVLKSVIIAASLVSICYAVLDEFHQLFVPGRVSDPLDLLIDAIGIGLAALILPPLLRWKHRGWQR